MMLDNRSFDALDFKPIKPLIGVKLLRLFSSLANCTLLGAEPCFDGIELVGAVLYLRGKRQDLALELHTQEDEPDKLFVSLAKIEKKCGMDSRQLQASVSYLISLFSENRYSS